METVPFLTVPFGVASFTPEINRDFGDSLVALLCAQAGKPTLADPPLASDRLGLDPAIRRDMDVSRVETSRFATTVA